jgi:hypothetical protein
LVVAAPTADDAIALLRVERLAAEALLNGGVAARVSLQATKLDEESTHWSISAALTLGTSSRKAASKSRWATSTSTSSAVAISAR